jgi:hypothetical protein
VESAEQIVDLRLGIVGPLVESGGEVLQDHTPLRRTHGQRLQAAVLDEVPQDTGLLGSCAGKLATSGTRVNQAAAAR